jgi:hypothetical protein
MTQATRPSHVAVPLLARAGLVMALLAGASCTHMPPVARPYPAPSAEQLAGLLAARATAVRAMNARARATSWLGGERVRATVLMLVTRDGHLRFEAEVSLQGTVATLATDGQTFTLLDARKNELSRGPACPANVASLLRIPLAPADVAAITLGDVRRPPEATVTSSVTWDSASGTDVLELVTPVQTLHVFFARHGAAIDLVGAEALVGGKRRWRTSYEDFANTAAARLPTTIRFAEGTGSYDDGVEIKLKDRELNGTPPDGAFTLTPPPGVTVKDVGCGG